MFKKLLQMPDEARLWVYALDRTLNEEEAHRVDGIFASFLPGWNSHGVPVRGTYELWEERFLLVAGDCPDGIGGCSTDASVGVIREIERTIGVNAFDRTLVFFRNGGDRVVAVSRTDFQELVNQKHVTPDTHVFDTTIQTVGDLRRGGFETTFERSWHGRVFQPR